MSVQHDFTRDFSHKHILGVEQKLTPELVHLIKVIQTPRLEQISMIYQELQENPCLELSDFEEIHQDIDEEEEIDIEEIAGEKDIARFIEEELPYYFEPTREEEEGLREQFVHQPTLKEHLDGELRLHVTDPDEIEIGEFIIEYIDEHGFLKASIQEISKATGASPEKVEKVLKIIQSFDPPGIAARDVREALIIQVKRMGMDGLILRILEEAYDEFKKMNLQGIAKKLGVDIEEIRDAVEFIRSINPVPAKGRWGEVSYVVPHVIVEEDGDDYRVILNEYDLPFIRISPVYLEMLKNPENYDKKTLEFVREKMRKAILFLRGLELSRETFRKIVEYIIERQKEFLKKGIMYKKPLRMREIAEAVGVHESTVSRKIQGVYIQTPRGVFRLKDLLSKGVGEDELSRDMIKERIRLIIENERKERPLSDGEIAEILRREGISIGRRTVAKYRGELGIPPANIRRKMNA